MKKALTLLVVALIAWPATTLLGQSPSISGAVTRLEIANLQARSEKGQNNGYAPLGAAGLVPPTNLFPSFTGSPDGTIWVKSGVTFAALSGVTFSSGGVATNNVLVGLVDTAVHGLKVTSVNSPLVLRGGDTINRVMVDYNQSIGGATSNRGGFTWFIAPTGIFSLKSGTLDGDVSLNTHALSGLTQSSGTALTITYGASPTLTSTSGNIVMVTPTGGGVVVSSNGASDKETLALNTTAADLMYGRKDSTNTWAEIQTFSAAPVVPDSSFAIAKVTSLSTSLAAALKRDGSNAATANISMGGFKLTNVGSPTLSGDAVSLGYLASNYDLTTLLKRDGSNSATANISMGGFKLTSVGSPTLSGDAVTLGYLEANYDSTPVNSITVALSGAGIEVNSSTGDVTLSIPRATTSIGGYLHQDDWNTFKTPSGITNAKISSILSSQVSAVNITNTAQTSLSSYTIPATALVAGDVIRFKVVGNFILEGAETISLVFAVGGSTVFTISLPGAGFTPSTSEVPYEIEITMVVRTAGASGTAVCFAALQTPTYRSLSGPSAISLDTTASRLLNLLATISAITGTNHISSEMGITRIN